MNLTNILEKRIDPALKIFIKSYRLKYARQLFKSSGLIGLENDASAPREQLLTKNIQIIEGEA